MADAALLKELEPLLRDPKHTAAGGIMSFCPAHPDGQKHGNRSLHLHPVYGLTCFAGCTFEAILAGLRGRNGFGVTLNGYHHDDDKHGKTIAVYEYRNEAGELIAEKCRIEFLDGRKQFKWRLPSGSWDAGLGAMKLRDMPLYGAEVIDKADPAQPVWFAEGEKAQRSLALQGLLAVTHGGGASTKDFGTSLNVLRGRTVILWPDNDAAGRNYMTTVQARLRGIAADTRYAVIPIALPEKGDAYDYFVMGGKLTALQDAQKASNPVPQEPTVEMRGEDSLMVTLPSINGAISFLVESIEIARRAFDAEVTITIPGAEPYNERVNLLSSSQRTELRRELDTLYGKEFEWSRTLNKAFGLARSFYGGLDRSLDVADVQTFGEEEFDIADILPKDQPTICFGDGGASKSTLACALSFHYCLGMPFLGRATPGKPVLYVDWEDTPAAFVRCIRRIGGAAELLIERGLLHYWPANGLPLTSQADAIKAKVLKAGIGLVIYDSVAPGCGGPPEDSVSATSFMNAVRRIGCTALCIAHITKQGQEDKPFGSAFWHNSARRTWLVKRDSDEDTDVLDVALICKKVNHGRKPRSIPVRMTFTDPDGLIDVRTGEFPVSSELTKAATSLNSRIKQALARGAMTRAEIAETIGENQDHVRNEMNRHREMYQPVGDKWGLAK